MRYFFFLPAFFFAVFLAAFFFVAMLRLLQELTKGTALQRPALASRVSNRWANRPSSRILRRDPRFRGANPTGKAMLRRGSGRSSAPATALSARAPALPEQPGRQRASPLSSPVASASPSRRDAWPSPALWLASPSGPRLPSSQRAAPCRARRTSSLRVSPSPALRLASAWRERQPSSSYLPSLPCPCSRQFERTNQPLSEAGWVSSAFCRTREPQPQHPPGALSRRPIQKCRRPGRAPTSLTPAARDELAPESLHHSSAFAEKWHSLLATRPVAATLKQL